MKYIWESHDIIPGRRIWAYNRSEQYIVGFDPKLDGPFNYTLTSLADGMLVFHGYSVKQLVDDFNKPLGMRPDTVDELDVNGKPILRAGRK